MRNKRFTRRLAASLVFALGTHALGGVVPIGAAAPTDEPAPTAAVSEASEAQAASPVQVAIAEQTPSAWMTLLDDGSSGAPTEEAAKVVSSTVSAAPAATAAPGAVIPLPAAIYPALLTLGGAGWVAFRSRNGRRL